MELYILRHGTTEWNRTHRLQGRTDTELDGEGIRLAKETGEKLKDLHFDAAYSSPLKRAYDTAVYVLGDRKLPIIKDERLAEFSFGDWEGMNCDPGNPKASKEAIDSLKFNLDNYTAPPHGESMQELIDRTHSFYDEIIHKPELQGKRILVSMHGGSGRALMHSVWQDRDFWHGKVPPNCSFCIVTVENGKAVHVEKDVVYYSENVTDYYAIDKKA
ncbi:MAG TPA: histidine phosphatase family protein [Lachnospiraceae bacterium]|nr:histidine phosphatase family protein [Lachnospiraceae bacterium]